METGISTTGPRIVELDEYDTATLTCIADGIPRPSAIFWFRNATLMNPVLFRKINITQSEVAGYRQTSYQGIESTLTIENINHRTDEGLYLCRSGNDIGQPAILAEPYNLRIIEGTRSDIIIVVLFNNNNKIIVVVNSLAPSLNLCVELQPCANEGTCIDTDSSYYCICSFDYTGLNCEEGMSNEWM